MIFKIDRPIFSRLWKLLFESEMNPTDLATQIALDGGHDFATTGITHAQICDLFAEGSKFEPDKIAFLCEEALACYKADIPNIKRLDFLSFVAYSTLARQACHASHYEWEDMFSKIISVSSGLRKNGCFNDDIIAQSFECIYHPA